MKKYFLGLLFASSLVLPITSMALEYITVTLSSTTPPTITKEIVDGEPYLKTNFTVNVKALDNYVYLHHSGGMGPYFQKDQNFVRMPEKCLRTVNSTGDLVLVRGAIGDYYKLAKGGQAVFRIGVSCKISEMFSGEYLGKIGSISYNTKGPDPYDGWNYKDLNFITNTTQYIVGERSPWINGPVFNAQSTEGGYLITLTGERLTQVTSLFVNNKTFAPLSRASSSINFLVKAQDLPLGSYAGAYLNSPTGKSNNFIVDVKGSITVIAPDNKDLTYGETWVLGESKNITWDYSNVTNVSIILINKDTLRSTTIVSSMPASAKSYSWKVGNTMMGMMNPGNNYKIKIYGVADSSGNGRPIAGLSDETDRVFSIAPSIKIFSPSGGENLYFGETSNIAWDHVGDGFVQITFLNETRDSVASVGYAGIPANKKTFTWKINDLYALGWGPGSYRVRLAVCNKIPSPAFYGCSMNESRSFSILDKSTSTSPSKFPTITGVVLGDCLAGTSCTWRAGTEKTYLWGYINPNTPANNTISVSVCSPNGATCMVAVDGSGNLLNKVPSKIGTGLGNMNGSVVALGRNVLTNPDLKSIIINGQSSLKVCPTNSDGSAVVGGVCKFSLVFTITQPLALNNSFNSQQLANLVSALSDLLAKIKELAK